LQGYTRHPGQDFAFLGMIPGVGKSVEGYIYTDVSPLERKLLDWFEGDEYLRQMVQATVDSEPSSSSMTVEAYVWKLHLGDQLLQDQEWSYEKFLQQYESLGITK
jgi:hypothetical protein